MYNYNEVGINMKKIKRYITRVLKMDYKQLNETIKYVKQRTDKSSLSILKDIMDCSIKYQTGFSDYREFEFYLLNDEQRQTFITSGINRQIVSHYNNFEYHQNFENKINFLNTYKQYINRDFLNLNAASLEDFTAFITKHKKVVTKILDEVEGNGVKVIDYTDFPLSNIKDEYDRLKNNRQFLIEQFFVQNDIMSKLSPKSVNTLRIITFLNDDQEVVIMNQVLKAGLDGELDNYGQGGMYTILSEDGRVVLPFIDKQNNVYFKHPITDFEFIGFEVPMFDKIINKVKQTALVNKEVRYLGWDFAVGVDDVEIIECNYYSYPFQPLPSISDDKKGFLPKYKKAMKDLFE